MTDEKRTSEVVASTSDTVSSAVASSAAAECCPAAEGEDCRAYHHGDLRSSLLAAARELLAERGIDGTSLRAIARRAGVSNRAPYHHFSDKMSLLAELAREGFTELGRRMSSHEDLEDPEQRLGLLGHDYLAFAGQYPTEFGTMYWPQLCDETNFPDREECSKPAFDPLIRALSEIAGPAATEEGLQRVAVSGWSAVHGLATLRAQGVLDHMLEPGLGEEDILAGVLECTHRMLLSEAKRAGGLDDE